MQVRHGLVAPPVICLAMARPEEHVLEVAALTLRLDERVLRPDYEFGRRCGLEVLQQQHPRQSRRVLPAYAGLHRQTCSSSNRACRATPACRDAHCTAWPPSTARRPRQWAGMPSSSPAARSMARRARPEPAHARREPACPGLGAAVTGEVFTTVAVSGPVDDGAHPDSGPKRAPSSGRRHETAPGHAVD